VNTRNGEGIREEKLVTRRKFIRTTGLGGLALGLGSSIFNGCTVGSNTPGTGREQIRGNRDFGGPYNILFVLVDQESYFKEYPRDLRLPGHERLKANGAELTPHD